jgi:membrane protein implicated in regulation of membrane protease activity
MIAGFLSHVEFWHWWVLGVALIILEAFAPGAFFLWLGIAAGIAGAALLVFPSLGVEYQGLIFALFAVASIVVWRRYLKRNPIASDRPQLNRRGEQYIGRTMTLAEPIVEGRGKIRLGDTLWRIEGADLPAGSQVRVVGVDGTVLKVEAA